MEIVGVFNSLSKTRLFLIIVFSNILISWLLKIVLVNDIVFYNTYSEQLTYERSMVLFENMKRFAWIGYLLIPILLFLKFLLISIVLYTCIFLYNLNNEIRFSTVFKIVIGCEIIFVFAAVIKFLWFTFFGGNYDLNDLTFFYPLSLINLFTIAEVDRIWIYPLQIVNLFQILYILALSYGLKKFGGVTDSSSDRIVLSSYVPAMAIWVALIIFISLDSAV